MQDRRYSILQTDFREKCYICGTTKDLQIHEVFFGTANRKKSIKYGCCLTLCAYHHNASNQAVHYNHELDIQLKMEMQRRFIKVYPNVDFRKVFGKNYL